MRAAPVSGVVDRASDRSP